MIEANRASSSANEVSMTTWVFGCLARISRVASIPLPSARRTSMTTTSGRVRSASSTASRTVAASPVTTMSSVACRRALIPPRTTSWSSTSRTCSGGCLEERVIRLILAVDAVGDASRQAFADPVQEILHGGLGHPVEQGLVEHAPHRTKWRPVPGTDGQLGPADSQGRDLDVGLELREDPPGRRGPPGDRQHRLGRDHVRLADLDLDLLVDAAGRGRPPTPPRPPGPPPPPPPHGPP